MRASLEATFDALLEQMGPSNETPDGKPCRCASNRSPAAAGSGISATATVTSGGTCRRSSARRSSRIVGPLFMSSPVISNLQCRLTQVDGGTLIAFQHSAFGFVPDQHREGLGQGWQALFDRISGTPRLP